MKRSSWIRILAVTAVSLALAAGTVGALAATRDSGSSTQDGARQESTPPAEQPWLGILAHPAKDSEGVVVGQVVPDSPADTADIVRGDIIVAIDSTDIQDFEDLRDAIDDKAPGDKVTLAVIKDGVNNPDAKAEDVDVTLAARPEPVDIKGLPGELFGKGFDKFLGGSFRYLDDEGNEVEIEAIPGTVKTYADSRLTIDVYGDEGDRTFDIPDDAKAPDELAEGDNVTVILKDGAIQGVHPGGCGLGFGAGMPFGPGHGRGHGHGHFDKMPFGDGPMEHFFPGGAPFQVPNSDDSLEPAEPDA